MGCLNMNGILVNSKFPYRILFNCKFKKTPPIIDPNKAFTKYFPLFFKIASSDCSTKKGFYIKKNGKFYWFTCSRLYRNIALLGSLGSPELSNGFIIFFYFIWGLFFNINFENIEIYFSWMSQDESEILFNVKQCEELF